MSNWLGSIRRRWSLDGSAYFLLRVSVSPIPQSASRYTIPLFVVVCSGSGQLSTHSAFDKLHLYTEEETISVPRIINSGWYYRSVLWHGSRQICNSDKHGLIQKPPEQYQDYTGHNNLIIVINKTTYITYMYILICSYLGFYFVLLLIGWFVVCFLTYVDITHIETKNV